LDEKDWCTKGHVGYVLEGRLAIGFSTNIVEFKAGDGLFILPGEDDKHKAKVRKGDKALLILFEEI
jgi:ethanolamine utilization protein EutQ (cupin superfamily)